MLTYYNIQTSRILIETFKEFSANQPRLKNVPFPYNGEQRQSPERDFREENSKGS